MGRPRKTPLPEALREQASTSSSVTTVPNPFYSEQAESVSKALLNPQDQPDRFKLSAIGYSGLQMFDGITTDELHKELQWPNSLKTYKKMTYNTSVNASLTLYNNLISKVNWRVVPPPNATEQEKQETEFISQCLQDMEIPLREVIQDCLSSNIYGFYVGEKVYRRRNRNSGSMYNDNKIGLKKIASRNQESIEKFIFDENGNDVVGVKQVLTNVNTMRYTNLSTNSVVIPRSKLLHVTTGTTRGDPYGKSPLRDVYVAWRYLEVLSELEAVSVQKDLTGSPVIRIPASYMSSDASPEQKQIYQNFCNMGRNLQVGAQTVVVLPSNVDETTRTPLFDLQLLSNEGGKKNFDLNEIKNFYQNQIYIGMSADILLLGVGSQSGSFNLASVKNTITGSAAETMLDRIIEAFNRDVIKQLYELNNMDVSRACRLDYENLHNPDLDIISRFGQRLKAVGILPRTHDVVNYFLTAAGLDPVDDSTDLDEILGESTSRSGDSLNTPSGGMNGTADTVEVADNSANNLENA